MSLVPEWAPSIHPLLVHFPIAILSVAVLFDFISFFLAKRHRWWTKEATLTLYAIGALTAIVVYFTGQAAADAVFLPAEAQSVLNTHADWAWWTVWFYGIYAAARLLAVRMTPARHHLVLHLGFFALSLVGIYLLYNTGDNGGRMVFEHGVGVQKAEVEEPVASGGEQEQPAPTGFTAKENGDWSWEIEAGALQVLQEQFHFIQGSAEQLGAEAVQTREGSYALQFSGDELRGFFITHGTYQNVQVDYYLDLSGFEGTVTLANHVQDSHTYDYVSISSDGTVEQGRLNDGQPKVFEKGSTATSRLLFVRAVANGTHFRGYVDKQMVVHGHGDAPKAGSVGLKVEGSGTLLLEKMELVQL